MMLKERLEWVRRSLPHACCLVDDEGWVDVCPPVGRGFTIGHRRFFPGVGGWLFTIGEAWQPAGPEEYIKFMVDDGLDRVVDPIAAQWLQQITDTIGPREDANSASHTYYRHKKVDAALPLMDQLVDYLTTVYGEPYD